MLSDKALRRILDECVRAVDDPDVDHRENARLLLAEITRVNTLPWKKIWQQFDSWCTRQEKKGKCASWNAQQKKIAALIEVVLSQAPKSAKGGRKR